MLKAKDAMIGIIVFSYVSGLVNFDRKRLLMLTTLDGLPILRPFRRKWGTLEETEISGLICALFYGRIVIEMRNHKKTHIKNRKVVDM